MEWDQSLDRKVIMVMVNYKDVGFFEMGPQVFRFAIRMKLEVSVSEISKFSLHVLYFDGIKVICS